MQPSARDKRIRICGGLVIMALAILSLFMVFASGREHWADIPLDALYGIQALFTLGAGIYLASGWRKASQMVMAPGRARRIALAAIAVAGTAAVAWGFTNGAKALITAALWPNMVGLWTLLQFRTIAERFQHKEQWTTALTLEFALESLARVFRQPGLIVTTAGQDVWVEIEREWNGGTWSHKDAARYMKSVTGLHFRIEEIVGGTRITANSGDRTVGGMYDVLKLSEEMSATAVELARQATARHHEG
ncbi:hypothetical protein BMF89_01100 [Arthrobacter sp. SRS-W-1-2016]|uniref:hypothetical protein n=1 Tax=Arthrobacter sp. SRS-W-1-2016 TaxID=1930254 RepID=UPI000990B756|nr:hypothetical protein [Arthrobacter sp. SRS-W-1-2016]OOP65022.1 hypothetical protein BMF89_01100 [Arthrobacter sp. SRS-W-1-2016]